MATWIQFGCVFGKICVSQSKEMPGDFPRLKCYLIYKEKWINFAPISHWISNLNFRKKTIGWTSSFNAFSGNQILRRNDNKSWVLKLQKESILIAQSLQLLTKVWETRKPRVPLTFVIPLSEDHSCFLWAQFYGCLKQFSCTAPLGLYISQCLMAHKYRMQFYT